MEKSHDLLALKKMFLKVGVLKNAKMGFAIVNQLTHPGFSHKETDLVLCPDGLIRMLVGATLDDPETYFKTPDEAGQFYMKWCEANFKDEKEMKMDERPGHEPCGNQSDCFNCSSKKAAPMQENIKGIYIKYEKFFDKDRNKKCVRILEVNALNREELPIEYIDSQRAVWGTSTGGLTSKHTQGRLAKGCVYDWDDFLKRMDYIRKAGMNLTKINKKLRQEKRWSGIKEVTV